MSTIVSNCLPTAAAAASDANVDDDSSALKYNKNYRRIRRISRNSSLQAIIVFILLLLVLCMGWILGSVIGWNEVKNKVKDKMDKHRHGHHSSTTTDAENELLKEFEVRHQRQEQKKKKNQQQQQESLRRRNNSGGNKKDGYETATRRHRHKEGGGVDEDEGGDGGHVVVKQQQNDGDNNEGQPQQEQQPPPKEHHLLDDGTIRKALGRMVASYFSTKSQNQEEENVVVNDVKTFLKSEDPEWVEQLLEEAKAQSLKMIPNNKQHEPQPRQQDDEQQHHDTDDTEPKTPPNTMDHHLRNLEYISEHCLGQDDVVVDFGSVNDAKDEDALLHDAIDQARNVLRNCKLLVLRNVLPRDFITKKLIPKSAVYLDGLSSNKLHHHGPTTNGEHYFYAERDTNRWEVLLPQSLIDETKDELVLNNIFLDILQDGQLLGEDMTLMSAGVNFASPGAVGQGWHEDERYIFDDNSYRYNNIGGHDTPSIAVTVSIPLLDIEPSHGPTEFCLGSSALQGLSVWDEEGYDYIMEHTYDQSLVQSGSMFELYTKYGYSSCHPHFWSSPILQMGDVLMFDYQLKHRGGWNTHAKDARAILFLTYSRFWFKDSNFHQDQPNDVNDEEFQLLKSARFALPDNWDNVRKEAEAEKYTSIAALGPIDHHDQSSEDGEYYGNDPNQEHEFVISNKNIKSGIMDILLFWNKDEYLGTLPPGHTMRVLHTLRKGDMLSLRTKHKILHEFPVKYQGQVVFHKNMKPA